ncbi:hypothetical protein CDLVIII_3203 [Clostridium sp. DL-VIII]|uniref:DUF2806 domain-containing protein n=1 Tax=Clostridium sp. DL-VIII TaxID=641107 RepID=UPI00023AFFD0|nr:DUF2806 domain-containing protein [Clostridium sp. DL-VIII]EHI99777.1 hypothetical protein CDLVIII_3203 [Clostridium sp. DL-VIII]
MDEETKKSLISDLGGLSAPMTKLIEVVSNALGCAFEPWQTRRVAKATGDEIRTLSDAMKGLKGNCVIKKGELEIAFDSSNIEVRSLETMMAREVKKQDNIENVLVKAQDFIQEKESVSAEPVDQDWATRFFNIAQDVSDEEMQNLWAKILSDEVEEPKSYSLRTLEAIRNLSKEEAKLVTKFCELGFGGKEIACIVGDDNFGDKKGIKFLDRILLEELNIAKFNLRLELAPNEEIYLVCGDKVICIESTEQRINIPIAKFTTIGSEIYNLVKKNLNISYAKEVADFIKDKGVCNVKLADFDIKNDKCIYDNKINL